MLPLFRTLDSTPKGLTEAEAAARVERFGPNEPPTPTETSPYRRLRDAVGSPFVALLSALCVTFVLVGDLRAVITVAAMVALSVILRLWQHTRSDHAMRALRRQVTTTATVRRRAADGHEALDREIPVEDLVPGDVVVLAAGDIVPADVRLINAVDLLVDQSAVTGETLPVRKGKESTVELPTLCFAGTPVVGGSATAVVVATGADTCFGTAAQVDRPESSFDVGVRAVGWTLVRFMLVMVPIVLVVNGTITGNWSQAAMFALAVAVGLTPEMLPVIVTTNLARGAVRLARRKVIVKRLNAVQDLGGMDVLCVDKTGTLTEDRVAYAHSVDPLGRPDGEAAEYAYLAVHFQVTPLNNLDEAIADQLADEAEDLLYEAMFRKVDEIAFDHDRRRCTVILRKREGIVRQHDGEHLLITKGDPERVLPLCSHVQRDGEVIELTEAAARQTEDVVRAYAEHGMRVLAVAARQDTKAEKDLVLVGFVGFVDPVRASAAEAVRDLTEHGVAVKILTGDNEHVAEYVAVQAGVRVGEVMLGKDIDAATDEELVEHTVFARLTPAHKARIVTALRSAGHAVGFIGDGVNDAAALRIADVGISADSATDVAQEAADLLLTDRDLTVVAQGVVEGRRTLGNTMKYVNITASSNFGNVFTVLAASAFLPFLPMLPIQLITQNLLYDCAQLALPWDRVDNAYLRAPRRWDARGLARFMLVFGPVSSLFDLAMFAALWWALDLGGRPELFQTGWFVESLLSQVLVVLVLRSRGGWLTGQRASSPSRQVLLASIGVTAIALALPLTGWLDLRALPATYFLWLAGVLAAYTISVHLVKASYLRVK
ncbi:Mg2+-importing ATPase [Kutzneria buriramensis]|uniref:Magnesium-transporting ATPase, P-type 1 n=2 Tax=Kutzneria buriramensis TaxID=1045776 RepID=A0A3E0H7U5_9PSEU|nr:Mg2+-importing ATPase [Kutzneria buriramensis]